MSRPLSVVVPAFNEEQRLPALLDAFETGAGDAFAAAGFDLHELVVVDDGSTDGTAALLEARAARLPALEVIRLPENRGKGAAVRAGMLAATAPVALLTDADLATPLGEVGALAVGLDGGYDVAIGSRGLPGSTIVVHQPAHRELLGKTFNVLARTLTGLPFHDTQCGFKLFDLRTSRRLFELQRIDGFAYDAELLVLARCLGLRVAEIPVRWSNDERTSVGIVRAPLQMARDLLRIAWLARVGSRSRTFAAEPAERQSA